MLVALYCRRQPSTLNECSSVNAMSTPLHWSIPWLVALCNVPVKMYGFFKRLLIYYGAVTWVNRSSTRWSSNGTFTRMMGIVHICCRFLYFITYVAVFFNLWSWKQYTVSMNTTGVVDLVTL